MASEKSQADYIVAQLSPIGQLWLRRMFGEYCIYAGNKPLGFIIDNMFFMKNTPEMKALHPEVLCERPWSEAGDNWWKIEDVDDAALLRELALLAIKYLPEPKPKKPRAPKAPAAPKSSKTAKPASAKKATKAKKSSATKEESDDESRPRAMSMAEAIGRAAIERKKSPQEDASLRAEDLERL